MSKKEEDEEPPRKNLGYRPPFSAEIREKYQACKARARRHSSHVQIVPEDKVKMRESL
jgi:hypothetical protein